jgi:hypothetical protein
LGAESDTPFIFSSPPFPATTLRQAQLVHSPAAFTHDPTLVRPVKLGIKKDPFGQSAISHRRLTAAQRAYRNSARPVSKAR